MEIKTKNYSKELRHVKKYISNENINKELKPYAESIFKNCNISEGFMIDNDSIIWYYDNGSWLIEEDDLKEDEIEPLSKEEKIKDFKSSLNSFSSEHSYIWDGGETFAAGGHYDGLNGINNSNKKRSFIEFGVSYGVGDFLIFHFGLTKKGYKLLSIHNYVWSP